MYRHAEIEEELPPHRARPADAPHALEGVRVVDFSHFIAGPFAAMMLADFGADVIKIEPPGKGDDLRYYPPTDPALGRCSAPFLWANRNKRSVALDLKNSEALAAVRELVAGADVLVENFSGGVMERLGLGWEECRALNPRLVYCSISAYGRRGAHADRLGFDPVVQAESGFMSLNGHSEREGVRTTSSVMDIGTAMLACSTILAALLARGASGQGQYCEVALYDAAMVMVGIPPMQYLYSGVEPQRNGNTSTDICPSGVFRCADGSDFYLNCGNDLIFRRLCEAIDRMDLCEPDTFGLRVPRLQGRDRLDAILAQVFMAHPWDHWRARLRGRAVPCGEVRSIGEAVRSAETRERALVTRIPHASGHWVANVALPPRMSATPLADPVAAPPLGHHTKEVLRDVLGCDDGRLATMQAAGAFGPVS